MTKSCVTVFFLVSFIFVGTSGVADKSNQMDERVTNYRLQADVSKKLLKFLEHKDVTENRRDCLAAAEKLLAENQNDAVNAAFIYAKMNWMLGEYSSADRMLNKIIKEYPSAATGVFKMPAAITAKFWLSAIMKEARQIDQAKAKYLEIVNQIESENINRCRGQAIFAYFYLSEIAEQENKPDESIKYLNKVINTSFPSDVPPYIRSFLANWAKFNIVKLSNGIESAQKTLKKEKSLTTSTYLVPVVILKTQGIIGGEGIFFDGSADNSMLMFYKPLETLLNQSFSNIDKTFAAFLLGQNALKHNDFAKAEKYYQKIYEGNSFWVPEAGSYLAICLEKQGRQEEKNKIIGDMGKRFPSYILEPVPKKN